MDFAVGGTAGDHGLRGATATGSPDLSREDVTFPPHLIPDDDRSEVRGSSLLKIAHFISYTKHHIYMENTAR